MFHRGHPKTKVRVCKWCALYVEAKLSINPEEEKAANHAASLDRGYLNDTFVKSFQSKRKILAPEDAVNAGHRLNRILQRFDTQFLAGNDLFVKSNDDTAGAGGPTDDDDEDAEAPLKTIQAERMPEVEVARFLQSSHKEPQPAFPAGTAHDCMSILFESSVPTSAFVSPSFQRLKDCLTSAHHVAINAEPEPLPPVVQPMYYY